MIEAAFAEGRIGSEQASLIARLATPKTVARYVARAECVTTRQFVREMRFLERLRDYDRRFAAGFAGPLPHAELEHGLRGRLLAHGWSEEALEKELKARRLCPPKGEAAWTGDLADPACNPVIMRRLELFYLLLVQTTADPARVRPAAGVGLDAQTPDPEDRQTSARSGAGTKQDRRTPQSPANEDRQTSARLNAAVTGGLRETSTSRIRFWAPLEIADHWVRAVTAIREEYAIELPGPPARIEPLPTWAAALFLIHQATSVWQMQDPETIPTESRILERDEHLCRIPGCSRRCSLESHHAQYRSRQGSDRMSNKVALCHWHHRAIHEGRLRLIGEAPHKLIVEIGCAEGQAPLFVLHGEKILWSG